MDSNTLSLKEAQKLILISQKLLGESMSPQEIIEHLGYVQIDTISVVERAHHHVFWTRNSKYKPKDLDDLISSRKAFEYWSHAASYLPMRDYRYSLVRKKEFIKKESSWFPRDPKLMKAVLKRIEVEGPLRSKDFDNTKKSKSTGWWDWKPAKKTLERLFMEGKLEITRREGFQKVYDLPERVIPSSIDTSFPTKKEYARFLIQRTIKHHGLINASEAGYLQKKNVIDEITKELKEMVEGKEIIQVQIEGIKEVYYADPKVLNSKQKVSSKLHILSPFDNFIIQRKKLKRFFNFDYQIECYVPEPKRKYGYFSLPVFSGVTPYARIDCKADRENKTLLIQSIHFEKKMDKDLLKSKLDSKLKAFAKFNGCEKYLF